MIVKGMRDHMTQGREHNLSDWLTLHELDCAACRCILDVIEREKPVKSATRPELNSGWHALELEDAWSMTLAAIRRFLPDKRSFIDQTFERTAKIVVDRGDGPRRALTLDRGSGEYPTILFSYQGEPADALILAHELGHALQIRASSGRFVPPVLREVCAFLGEGALLSHAEFSDPARHRSLSEVWQRANNRYFGVQTRKLAAALSRPDARYVYAWNYPIARYLAMKVRERPSSAWVWSLFEGRQSLREVVDEVTAPVRRCR